jgi:D-arginine dehydrogenase
MSTVDFVVIGAGIAGASVAYELAAAAHGSAKSAGAGMRSRAAAAHGSANAAGAGMRSRAAAANCRVVLLEREPHSGYHSTGRSAALFSEIYGNEVVRALSRASRSFLSEPPAAFADGPLLERRGVLYIATSEQHALIEEFRSEPDIQRDTREISTTEALELVPILRQEKAAYCALEPDAMDVEANALHQGFLKGLRARGGKVMTNCTIESVARVDGDWSVVTGAETFRAPVLINAAGAWADEIAALAGAPLIGLQPKRRTALLVQPPAALAIARWPMVMDMEETYYFKPDAGKLLLSPADETPSAPCDAQPDDLDVAIAVDRVEQATTLSIERVTHSWAGLRSFVADRSPVVGFDPACEGFFWLAAQGGYGIQTAPAMSRVAAALALGRTIATDIADHGVTAEALSPSRLRNP